MGLSGDGQLAVDASPAFGSLVIEAAFPSGTSHPEGQNGHSLPGLQSEMGSLIRSLDWATTPLGPVESWSQSLRMAVSFLLANRFPLLLWWGPQYISIYNDAYRPILGTKHPRALGQPVSEVWSEIWQVLQPLIDTPFAGGPATWMEDLELEINRHGFFEETHFTVAYSPVPDETATRGIGGVLATVHEITEKVIGERRVNILRDLSARASQAKTAEDACTVAAGVLSNHAKDVPFALLYLLNDKNNAVRLAGTAGVEAGAPVSPQEIAIESTGAPWPVDDLLQRQQMVVIENLASRFSVVPAGPWDDPPRSAVLVPLRSNKPGELVGFLVAGISARLRLDHLYRSFLELTAAQIATSIANARAYEEERKRAEALAEIDRAKTMFFSNVSHEFRTPLTLMLGPLEDALAGSQLPAAERERLTVAHRNSLRLLKLVNSLLDFSRIEAGRIQAVYQPTDLAAATSELASVFRSAMEKAGLTLVIDCPALPELAFVDREMWEKIVLNLISNAFKFTLEGEIEVKLREAEEHYELSVRDTGTGIPAHELPKLFERFHRVAGAQGRTHEGTGIGLALVQELAKLHGGSVSVESVEGQGSTFRVAIPRGRGHLPAEQVGARRSQASTALGAMPFVEEALRWLPGGDPNDGQCVNALEVHHLPSAGSGKHARILLADDNTDMRDYLRRLLETRYEVEAVADGEAALEAITRAKPDLVLTDVMMPRLDGMQLLAKLRSNPLTSTMPIILLSARAGEESRVEGMQCGADDYLIKPFSARELLARVESHIKMARFRHDAEQALKQSEHRLSVQLAAATRMQQVSTRLVQAGDISTLLSEMLDAAIELSHADMGNIQLLEHGVLKIVAQRGFKTSFLEFFSVVHDGMAACGAALQRGERIIVEDVSTSEIFASTPALPVMLAANARAVQSTPLVTRSGEILGMFSTHYKTPHRPNDHELKLLDALARQAADLLEQKQAEQTQQLLVNELNHRVKNTLASVQAIVQHTLRRTKDPTEFASSFAGRIQSLSRVHSLLSAATWQGSNLRDVIRDQLLLGAVDETRLTAWGPSVRLDPQMTLHMALMLHELGTNASKYGALSVPAGWVTVRWTVEGRLLHLRWEERGGPAVKPPTTRGFGTMLIEQSAKGGGGDARISVTDDGIVWEITMALAQPVAPQDAGARSAELVSGSEPRPIEVVQEAPGELAGKRFLVVEDEPLVALDISASLAASGATVLEITGGTKEALEIIETRELDAALLDGNLRGNPVDELAAALAHRKIPFLFVTGYGPESLPMNFRHVTILSKPFSQSHLLELAARLVQ
jgi:signal transduction histidine kinase/DNA-binding response OmpR family regulator